MDYATAVEMELVSRGCSVTRLKQKENWDILNEWRRRFSANLFRQAGVWVKDGYDWHVFSFGFTRHIEGPSAINYMRSISNDDLVLSPVNRYVIRNCLFSEYSI